MAHLLKKVLKQIYTFSKLPLELYGDFEMLFSPSDLILVITVFLEIDSKRPTPRTPTLSFTIDMIWSLILSDKLDCYRWLVDILGKAYIGIFACRFFVYHTYCTVLNSICNPSDTLIHEVC